MLNASNQLEASTLLKIYYFAFLLGFFFNILGELSHEQEERFYQNGTVVKLRYLNCFDGKTMRGSLCCHQLESTNSLFK